MPVEEEEEEEGVAILRKMNKSSVKYLQSINFFATSSSRGDGD
jgi:hypothetical protein